MGGDDMSCDCVPATLAMARASGGTAALEPTAWPEADEDEISDLDELVEFLKEEGFYL